MSSTTSPRLFKQTLTHPDPSWPTPCVIAIDGPTGAGKSSVSTQLAKRLQFFRLDTGVLYRGIALEARRAGLSALESDALKSFLKDFKQHPSLIVWELL